VDIRDSLPKSRIKKNGIVFASIDFHSNYSTTGTPIF
jgi:hypothetical protein